MFTRYQRSSVTNKKTPKVIAIVQARMSSTRLPGKVLMQLNGTTLLEYELSRLSLAKTLDRIVVATSVNIEDDSIETLCNSLAIDCFRGSLEDVLLRYVECSKKYPDYDVIVRITGDCPLIDPKIVDEVVTLFVGGEFDYASNIPSGSETFPDGMDCEVFSRDALMRAGDRARLFSEHEHVTPYIKNHDEFRRGTLSSALDLSAYRLTVDTQDDLDVVNFITKNTTLASSYLDYVKLLDKYPSIRSQNTRHPRNEGLARSVLKDNETN